MKKTEIFFPFEPVPKGRPRFTRTGHAYTPKATQDYEKQISKFYCSNSDDFYDSAIKIKLVFNMPIPKSCTKKNRELIMANEIKYIKSPDADNLAKAVLDSLNGLAFKDDRLITKLMIEKRYSKDGNVGTEMTITEDLE